MFGSPAVASATRRAGYNAYDNGIFSKHRGIYIDLDFTQLLGAVDSIVPAKARGLRSEDQISVDIYLKVFKAYADDHHIWERTKELTTVASTLTTDQCKISFDAIDVLTRHSFAIYRDGTPLIQLARHQASWFQSTPFPILSCQSIGLDVQTRSKRQRAFRVPFILVSFDLVNADQRAETLVTCRNDRN